MIFFGCTVFDCLFFDKRRKKKEKRGRHSLRGFWNYKFQDFEENMAARFF